MANTARETVPSRVKEITPQSVEKKAGIDEMLNNRKFLEALNANDPDAEVAEDNIELQEKYEAFGKAQEVSNEIIGIYKDKILKDIGIKMDKTEFQAIETYINNQVFENPKEIETFASQVKEYQEAPERIAQKEQEIAELTGGKDLEDTLKDLREQRMQMMDEKNRLEISKGAKETALEDKNKKIFIKRWFTGGSNKTRKKEISSLEGDIAGVNFSSEKLGEQIKNLEDANKLRGEIKNKADEAREKLFSNFEPMEEIAAKAREKVAEKFTTLFSEGSSGNLSRANEAQNFLDRMKDVNTEEEWTDYLDNMDTDLSQEQLDGVIEKLVSAEFEKAVDNLKIGERPLEKMENVLKPLLNKTKIGSKDREGVKDFMVKTLSDIAKNFSRKDLRRYPLNQIIKNVEKGLYGRGV